MDISNQIKTRREAMGLSQEQLAEKLYVSRQTISNWERDKTYPDVQSLLMLSILFDTSIDTLVKGDVTVMEEAVERDRKRMGTRMLWLAVLMLALLAVAFALILSPAFNWMEGTWGAGVAAAAAFLPAIAALVVATVLERIKRENDLVTYREILAVRNADRCFTATSAIVSTTRCSAPEPLAVDDGLADHDVEDLDVGVLHTHTAHVAHAGNRLLDGILDQTLAGTEATPLHGHVMSQNRRIDGSRNLGGTTRLGAVAHDAAHVTERIGDRRADLLARATAQPGNRSAGAARGANSTAKRRKRTNIALDMHGDKIGQHHGAYQTLVVATQVLGILHDGQCAGNALIARAAHNGDRQRATVHAGVGPGGRTGTGTAGDVIGTSTQQRTTHLGAPSVRKALGTDCAIQLNLTLNGSAGALNVTVLDKVDDGINGHGRIGVICRTLGHHALGAGGALPRRLAAYRNTVERMARDISVVIGNLDDRGMAPGRRSHLDVEVGHTLDKRHIAVAGVGEELGHTSAVFIVNALEHLKRALGVTAHGTQHGCSFNTVHTARVGHGHALYVLDDVARAGNNHMFGFATERLARQRRRIGNGNGLGAAERTDKLAVQNIAKRGITKGIGRHRYLLLA